MEEIKVKKNKVIFEEGALEQTMFDIRSGSVGIYSDYGLKDQKLLVALKEDEVFGEMGMIENAPRSATAVALEETVLTVINPEDFDGYFKSRPSKVFAVLQHTSRRMRELSADYINASAAVSEYIKAEENGGEKSPEFINRMRKIAGKGMGKRK